MLVEGFWRAVAGVGMATCGCDKNSVQGTQERPTQGVGWREGSPSQELSKTPSKGAISRLYIGPTSPTLGVTQVLRLLKDFSVVRALALHLGQHEVCRAVHDAAHLGQEATARHPIGISDDEKRIKKKPIQDAVASERTRATKQKRKQKHLNIEN